MNVSVIIGNSSFPLLRETEQHVKFNAIDNAFLQSANVVILTEFVNYEEEVVELDDRCASLGIHFISACVRGLFGFIFCNFLKKFTILDVNGEPLINGIYEHLSIDSNRSEVIVTCHEDSRHQLERNDSIQLSSMKSDSSFGPYMISRVIDAYSFCIPVDSILSTLIACNSSMVGEFTQVKIPKVVDFVRISRNFILLEERSFISRNNGFHKWSFCNFRFCKRVKVSTYFIIFYCFGAFSSKVYPITNSSISKRRQELY